MTINLEKLRAVATLAVVPHNRKANPVIYKAEARFFGLSASALSVDQEDSKDAALTNLGSVIRSLADAIAEAEIVEP